MTLPERLHVDKKLFGALLLLGVVSLFAIHSASAGSMSSTMAHFVRLLLGMGVLVAVAQIRPQVLERWTPAVYVIALLLVLATLAIGVVGKGAQRWLSLGFVRIQPSEFMKLAVPMMVAWFLARDSLPPKLWRIAVGFAILTVPALMIARQPDLGTALLVGAAGLFVLFLAGMHWRVIAALAAGVAVAVPFAWQFLHDYQKNRVLTLLDPQADPLGSGYHTIQSMIAIGSGGFYGKGWLNSSQAHLEYLPESATDFIFAVYAEEFGLIGSLLLVGLYLFVVLRGMLIAYYAQDAYTRLLAGSISLVFFVSFFINAGMVSGILPVVGVPLPILSYGGTSLVTLMAAFGILMSIHSHRRIVEQ